jgi:hypothetical protein
MQSNSVTVIKLTATMQCGYATLVRVRHAKVGKTVFLSIRILELYPVVGKPVPY